MSLESKIESLEVKNYCEDFFFLGSHRFATVIFTGNNEAQIIRNGKFFSKHDNVGGYAPQCNGDSSCDYVYEEGSNRVIKICTLQHKGNTSIEILPVSNDELVALFLFEL